MGHTAGELGPGAPQYNYLCLPRDPDSMVSLLNYSLHVEVPGFSPIPIPNLTIAIPEEPPLA